MSIHQFSKKKKCILVFIYSSLTSRGDAPAVLHKSPGKEDQEGGGCLLGAVPHSIRGFLASWDQLTPATHRFSNCIACSEKVQIEKL